jgi:hypothetical protein
MAEVVYRAYHANGLQGVPNGLQGVLNGLQFVTWNGLHGVPCKAMAEVVYKPYHVRARPIERLRRARGRRLPEVDTQKGTRVLAFTHR